MSSLFDLFIGKARPLWEGPGTAAEKAREIGRLASVILGAQDRVAAAMGGTELPDDEADAGRIVPDSSVPIVESAYADPKSAANALHGGRRVDVLEARGQRDSRRHALSPLYAIPDPEIFNSGDAKTVADVLRRPLTSIR